MKKWKLGLVCAVLAAALVGTTTAFASDFGGHHGRYAGSGWSTGSTVSPSTVCPWNGSCWRDTDSDGVRDTWNGTCADADKDGICDICGQTVHSYTDANGDGICDHYGSHYGSWSGSGSWSGGHHSGQGHCRW